MASAIRRPESKRHDCELGRGRDLEASLFLQQLLGTLRVGNALIDRRAKSVQSEYLDGHP